MHVFWVDLFIVKRLGPVVQILLTREDHVFAVAAFSGSANLDMEAAVGFPEQVDEVGMGTLVVYLHDVMKRGLIDPMVTDPEIVPFALESKEEIVYDLIRQGCTVG